MSHPFLSFVIPALNEEHYLPKLLGDIKKQTDKDFEVIVVDAHSEDKTREVAIKFAEYYPLTVLVSQKRNLSYQRNLGAEKAKGEYLIIIDADSRIKRNFTAALKKEIHKCHRLILLPTIVPDRGTAADKVWFNTLNFLTEMTQYVGKPAPSISCMIFQRDFFRFLGGYLEKGKDQKTFFPEDHEIIMRARKRGIIAQFMKGVKVGFSLRRAQKEGRLQLMAKYVRSSWHMTFNGTLDQNFFDYEMGGHVFDKKEFKKRIQEEDYGQTEALSRLLKQFKASFKEILQG